MTLEKQFKILLTEMSQSLTVQDVDQITELVDANELGVAFENFCMQLYERGATCSPEQLVLIGSIGTAMNINPEYWERLETL